MSISKTRHQRDSSTSVRDRDPSRNSTDDTSLRSNDALMGDLKRGPKKRNASQKLDARQIQAEMAPDIDPRDANDLAEAHDLWAQSGEKTPADEALDWLYNDLRQHPHRSISDEQIAFCTPTDRELELINPYAMSLGMQVSSALAGGTTAYLVSFGASELLTASVRASGTPLPAWGHGLLAGTLHSVFAEVLGMAMRGNRGTYASPANKAFDTQLKAFCDGIEKAWISGESVDYGPLKELVSKHLLPHMLSDELAFSPFGVSGAVAAYLNKTWLEKLVSPTHHRAAFEIGAAAVRIVLGAFIGGFGTAGMQHATRAAIQGSTPPAPGVVHRPERRAYFTWQYQTALTQRLAVLKLGLVNRRAALAQTSDATAQQSITTEITTLRSAITTLEDRLKTNETRLQTELAKMADTDEPLTAAETTQLDASAIRAQLAAKAQNWPAVRSTIATAVANSTAAAFGLLLPAIGAAQTLTPVGNQTVVDPYIQPVNDITANGLLPVSMIFTWMLMRRPLKMAVEMGMAGVAGILKRATTSGPESFRPRPGSGETPHDVVIKMPTEIQNATRIGQQEDDSSSRISLTPSRSSSVDSDSDSGSDFGPGSSRSASTSG